MKRPKASAGSLKRPAASVRKSKGNHTGYGRSKPSVTPDEEPLPPAVIRELKRRLRDSRDPVRYMLVSEFSRRFILYYDVSSDTYIMNEPGGGTLFKRREVAEAVKRHLGRGVSIAKYTTKHGKLKRISPYRGRWISRRGRNS